MSNAFGALKYVFMRHPNRATMGRPRDVVVAVLILFLVHLEIDLSYHEAEVTFSMYGFQQWLGTMSAWYLMIGITAILLKQEAKLGVVFVVTSMAGAVGAVFDLAWYRLMAGVITNPNSFYWGYILVGALPILIALSTLTAHQRLRNAGLGFVIAATGTVQLVLASYFFEPSFLFGSTEAYAASTEQQDRNYPDPEIIYPLQTGLMAEQIDNLKDQVPGQVDLFALVGAGYPSQTIFQREVAAMRGLLQDRFDAGGRTLRLGSNIDKPTEWPLLNRTNLTQGLAALSSKMDLDEDILLIFLTSHGSPDQISTSFSGLSYNNLRSDEVAHALETSGIRNAIIIISACYSGSFIDELTAPRRLIITASAGDRSSFGCSDSNEFTDWGNAVFNDALKQTYDFFDAAEIAYRSEKRSRKGLYPVTATDQRWGRVFHYIGQTYDTSCRQQLAKFE